MPNANALRKHLTLFAALCYVAFLAIDIAAPGPVSSALKYAGLLACATIAMTAPDRTLHFAMLLTAVSDYFLLFTADYVPGVLIFCCAQFLHATRHARLAKIRQAHALLPISGAALLGGAAAYALTGDPLYAASACYAVLLLGATALALAAAARKRCDQRAARMIAAGMLLFVLCDISVAAFNLGVRSAAILMWLFYLPSQWLLVGSASLDREPLDGAKASGGPLS